MSLEKPLDTPLETVKNAEPINSDVISDSDVISMQEAESMPTPPAEANSGVQSLLSTMVPMVLIFGVFYFLLIRPQEKKRRNQEDLVKSVKLGEEVLTSSGLFGFIRSINENDGTVEIQIAEHAKVKILRSAIVDVISRKNKK